MATYDYYKRKDTGSFIPAMQPGSNWILMRIQPALQPMAANDVLRILKVKNHWILKCALTRITTPTTAAATADIGTSSGGQELTKALDLDSASDTWIRTDATVAFDDDAPVMLTDDGYLYFECLDAGITDGVIDVYLEIIVPHPHAGDVTSNEG